MTINRLTATVAILALLLCAAGVLAAEDRDMNDPVRLRLIGVLDHTRVDLHLDRTPAREAFTLLEAALGLRIIGRWNDDTFGHGLAPAALISLSMNDLTGREAIEMILEQAARDAPGAWQLRRGYIEVGTKERLSHEQAMERAVYNIRDLLIDPPYFGSVNVAAYNRHPYREASAHVADMKMQGGAIRWDDQQLAIEIVRLIVETIEPGNWDYCQDPSTDPNNYRLFERTRTAAPRNRTSDRGRRGPGDSVNPHRINIIRLYATEHVVVIAPDFVHRQIIEELEGTPPPPLTVYEINSRNQRAQSETGSIRVRGVTIPGAKQTAGER